jgi:hypothetical protein
LTSRVCEAVADLEGDAVVAVGVTVDARAVPVSDSVEIMAYADHDPDGPPPLAPR